MSSTVITAFFDLTSKETSNRLGRDSTFYLEKGKDLLNIDTNMIIYTEEKFAKYINEQREEYSKKTRVITCNLDDLPYYKLLPKLAENCKTNPIKNACQIKDTPLYMILQVSKIFFLKNAIMFDPFETTHFAWVDFGISHIAGFEYLQKDEIFNNLTDKISMLQMRDFNNIFTDMETYCTHMRGITAGGFISGNKDNLLWFCDEVDKKYKHFLENGYSCNDEMIFATMFVNSDKFRLYYGDYVDIISNYRYYRTGTQHIINMAVWARDGGNHQDSYNFLTALYESDKYNHTHHDLAYILDNYYISCYYIDKDKAIKLVHEYINLVNRYEGARIYHQHHQNRILSNFKFLISDVENMFSTL